MPQPIDYTVAQPDVGQYFQAMRQGTADRQAQEAEAKQNALSRYLPQALQGDQAAQGQAMASATPDQAVALAGHFSQMDAAKLADMHDKQARVASLAQWADTPEKWQTANAEAQQLFPGSPPIPFEQRGMVIARSQTVSEQLKQALDEKKFALDRGQTEAQIRASNASANAANANADFIRSGKGLGPTGVKLSPTDKKEIYQTDDFILGTQSALSMLKDARNLSDRSQQGFGMNALSQVGSLVGDQISNNTIEFDNLLKNQALPQLKAIFGGMPTEGERAILLELQGSSSMGREARNRILDRAIQLADKRLTLYTNRSAGLRSGDYYRPSYGTPEGLQPQYGATGQPPAPSTAAATPSAKSPAPPPGFVLVP